MDSDHNNKEASLHSSHKNRNSHRSLFCRMKMNQTTVTAATNTHMKPVRTKWSNASGFVVRLSNWMQIISVSFSLHFQYRFIENGIKAEEQGEVKNKGTDNEIQSVRGSYSYTGPDGVLYTVTYIADENGFQPQVSQIPINRHRRFYPFEYFFPSLTIVAFVFVKKSHRAPTSRHHHQL